MNAVPPPSRGRRALFAALLALIPILFLIAVEVFFRLQQREDLFPTQTGFVEPDPDLIWRLKPRAEGTLRTNELGLRDGPYRADADVRILLLGDSVSWGNGIQDVQQIFPSLLEERLARARPGRTYEIINSGVPGYSTFQELRYLQTRGLQLKPHALILQVCLNDVTERYLTLAEYGGNSHFLGVDTRAAIGGVQGFLIRNSRAAESFFGTLQTRAQKREMFIVKNLARDELEPELEKAWEQMLSELDDIVEIARENDLPLLMLIAPFRFQADSPATLRQPQDRLLAWARGNGVAAIDVLPAIESLPPDLRREAFNDPSHFSELGHSLVAELLTEPVAELIAAVGRPAQ